MPKLYLVYMWGFSQNRLIEDHEIVLVVAENPDQAKQKAKEKTKLTNKVHIDSVLQINNVDGYDILLQKQVRKIFCWLADVRVYKLRKTMNLKEKWLYNLKIHYIGLSFQVFCFWHQLLLCITNIMD